MTQIGQRTRTRTGSNIESNFSKQQDVRAAIEEIQDYRRIHSILQQHADGKISSLSVTYLEIAKDPSVLNNVTPISREPSTNGTIIVWEGYTKEKPDMFSGGVSGSRGPLHQVTQAADGTRQYRKYNSVDKCWVTCAYRDPKTKEVIQNRFPIPMYRRAKSENWDGVGNEVVSRTVMNRGGETETRVYQQAFAPKAARR
jgi:hypothetical protein